MKELKTSIGKIIFWLLVIVFFWLVITHFAQTKQILGVISHGRWYWIALAVVSQIIFYPVYARYLEFILKMFGANLDRSKLRQVYLATKFTDIALPLGFISKVAFFIRYGAKENQPPLNIGIGTTFAMLTDLVAFLGIAIVTMLLLYIMGQPQTYLLVSLLLLALFILITILFLVQIAVLKRPPNRLVLWIIKQLSRMSGRGMIDSDQIEKIILEIGSDLKQNHRKIWPGLGLSLIAQLINMATFAFAYAAFAGQFNILAIITGFTAGLLFTIVSITPQGVGIAETVIVTTLRSFGLDLSVAAAITLAYRGLLYLLPVFVGFYYFSHLELKPKDESIES